MVKAKPVGKTGTLPKLPLKSVRQSAIHKKKNPKFKNTPTGKVNMINGSKMQNTHNMKTQKQVPKGKNASPEKSPKQQGGQKGSSQAKNFNNKKDQSLQASNGKRKIVKDIVPKDEESDSDEDYNEGIVIREEISMIDEDDIDDDAESDDDVPDIFETTLPDDSDEDDDDFDEEESVEDEEEEESSPQNKGIKMFTGVKSKKGADKDNSSDSATLNTSASSAQNSSFTTNDDYDDEDDEDEDDDDDEDTEDEESEDSEDEDEDVDVDEDEDEDDSDEEEEEEEDTGPGLKALLGNSLADDDDDEDFDGEEEDSEDEDISDEEDDDGANNSIAKTPEKTQKVKQQDTSPFEHEKHNEKTVFVGNLPVSTKKEQLIKLFKKFGPVQAVRLRGIIPMEEKMPKKVAAITKKVHPKVKTIYAYIIFQKEESAKAALALNGELFDGNYLRVDGTMKSLETNVDPKKSVFLGNLSFKADNNAIWEHFKDCGDIESVRIIKHNKTGVGKGIGYINFKDEDSVTLALKLDGTELVGRAVRVKPYTMPDHIAKKPKHEGKKRPLPQGSSNQSKKMKTSQENLAQSKEKSQKKKGQVSEDKQTSPQNKGAFQGQKVDLKKKKKPNKLEKQKKIMAAKLTAKSKKQAH